MDARLTEDERMLESIFSRFLATKLPPDVTRRMEHELGAGEAADVGKAFDPAIWKEFAGLGALQVLIPETAGGAEVGLGMAVVVAEQVGRALFQSPYFDTLTAAELIVAAGQGGGHWRDLEGIGTGDVTIALAVRDQDWDDPGALEGVTMTAGPAPSGQGYQLNGRKGFVGFARHVSHFLVVARESRGPTFFLLPGSSPGIGVRRLDEIGRGEYCRVEFRDTPAAAADVIGEAGGAGKAYPTVLARARVRHCGYLVGLCQGAFDGLLKYAKEREQFGKRIAAFQAISFRLAAMSARIGALRLLTHNIAWRADQGQDVRRLAAEATAMAGELAREVTAESMQMHGSFGFTEEAEPQRFYRRAAVDSMLLGTASQLRDQAMAWLQE